MSNSEATQVGRPKTFAEENAGPKDGVDWQLREPRGESGVKPAKAHGKRQSQTMRP